MSLPILTAAYARMNGTEVLPAPYVAAIAAQAALATLLTTDINTGTQLMINNPVTGKSRPRTAADAIRQGTKGQSVIWPEVVFRMRAGTIDKRFTDGSGLAVQRPILDLEVWDKSLSGTLIWSIVDAIMLLFDRAQGAPQLPLSSGAAVGADTFVTPSGPFNDPGLNAWFGLYSLQFVNAIF